MRLDSAWVSDVWALCTFVANEMRLAIWEQSTPSDVWYPGVELWAAHVTWSSLYRVTRASAFSPDDDFWS